MENLAISKENAIKAFDVANEDVKIVLVNLFGEKVFARNIMDRIKTVDDALAYNGKTKKQFEEETQYDTDAQRADKEIEEVAEALREGKELEMGQRWYYPVFNKPSGSSRSFSYRDCDCAYGCAGVGARHSVDTAEKAVYMGKQFIEVYNRRLGPRK